MLESDVAHWHVNVVKEFPTREGQRPNNDLLQHVVERFEEERRLEKTIEAEVVGPRFLGEDLGRQFKGRRIFFGWEKTTN